MKIYVSHASSFDYVNELYKPLMESDLWKDHEIFLPHEGPNADVKTKDTIDTFDLMIGEVSYPSTGQGIELGLAAAANIPIVCFYRQGTKPSGALRFYCEELIPYQTVDELLEQITTRTDR